MNIVIVMWIVSRLCNKEMFPIARFLITYRNTTSNTTGLCPAELMLGRKLRTSLDLLKPEPLLNKAEDVVSQKKKTGISRNKCFEVGDNVWVRDFTTKKKWMAGSVLKKLGAMMYLVGVDGSGTVRRHLSQIKRRIATTTPDDDNHATQDAERAVQTPSVRNRVNVPPVRLNYKTLGDP